MPRSLWPSTAQPFKTIDRGRQPPYWLWLALSIIGIVFLCGFGPPQLIDRTIAPTQRVTAAEAEQWTTTQPLPDLTAKAFLLYDVDEDKTLFAQNGDQALPPASLTKLMTALLVLEKGDLQAAVTIQNADLVGGSTMGLQAGETLTVEQLLWGLLLPSGNDAATALARQTAGSVEAFVKRMNERAVELGLKQTHFANPEGIDADNHASSANDLLILTKKNWAFPLFQKIVGTVTTTVAGHILRNTNELLEKQPGVNGVKTGTTDNAGECLVTSIQQGKHQIITIVLGSSARYSDTLALNQYYQANYTWVDGNLHEMAALNRLYAPDGQLWYLRATGTPPSLFIAPGDNAQLETYRRLQLPPPGLPWQSGMTVGIIEWRLGGEKITSQPLILW